MIFTTAFLTVLFWLMVGHAVADFALQSDFMSRGKNRNTEVGKTYWPYALFAHSIIHGGAVAAITGSVPLGVVETVLHGLIDFWKCEGRLTLKHDQFMHVCCKLVYAAMVAAVATQH
jgi:phosphotransferase system  glucose/maltose/N-acetylglucosamine-specific IIC component